MITGEALARTALVGNPSDGFGGAVIAAALANFGATVELEPIDGVSDVVEGPAGLQPLVLAGREVFRHHLGDLGAARLRVRTDVPREVGLAGSSAVVAATLRASAAQAGIELPADVAPGIALSAETEVLGIPGGLQDRVAQLHGGVVLCDLAPEATRTVDDVLVAGVVSLDPAVLPPLLLVWLPDAGESSATPHRDLRRRWAAGEPMVRRAMVELGGLARTATEALRDGEPAALGPAMTRSVELRAAMVPLHPAHAELVERIRATGADVNYSGSGGAVVTTVPDGGAEAVASAVEPMGAAISPALIGPPRD